MFKVGDKVTPFNHMSNVGTIVRFRTEPAKTWMVGGSPTVITVIIVEHADGETKEYLSSDLLRADR